MGETATMRQSKSAVTRRNCTSCAQSAKITKTSLPTVIALIREAKLLAIDQLKTVRLIRTPPKVAKIYAEESALNEIQIYLDKTRPEEIPPAITVQLKNKLAEHIASLTSNAADLETDTTFVPSAKLLKTAAAKLTTIWQAV